VENYFQRKKIKEFFQKTPLIVSYMKSVHRSLWKLLVILS